MPPEYVEHRDLHPATRTIRLKLSRAFLARYFRPYLEEPAGLVTEMALALFPPFKKLRHVNSMRLTYPEGAKDGCYL